MEYAANTPIVKDLRNLLEVLTVKDLRYIGDLFLINRLSNKPKKELVTIIYNALTDEKMLTDVIERFTDKEFKLLKNLIKNNGTIQDNNSDVEVYHFLYILGLIFLFRRDDKFYISMTADVYKVIKKMNLEKFNNIIEENTKVYNLLRAMVELYGVVSYGDFIDSYNLYYGETDNMDIPDNALYFCDRYDNISRFHTQNNMYFVSNIFSSRKFESVLDEIINRQFQIKRKPIKLNDLLKYIDYYYYEENDSRNEFKIFLKKSKISSDRIEQIMINITNVFKLGNSFIESTFAMLEEYGLEINEKNMQEILNYLMNIYNNSRIWSNNGWTPVEMRKNYYSKLNH